MANRVNGNTVRCLRGNAQATNDVTSGTMSAGIVAGPIIDEALARFNQPGY